MNTLINSPSKKQQAGLFSVEFVLIATLFISVFFLMIELARVMYLVNTASEATRSAARLAVVCDYKAPIIKNEITSRLPNISDNQIILSYFPKSCDNPTDAQAKCQTVTVSLVNPTITTVNPLLPITIDIPEFTTTLPRESMDSALNPACT